MLEEVVNAVRNQNPMTLCLFLLWKVENTAVYIIFLWASSIAVRALAYYAEDHGSDPPRPNGWTLAHCPPSSEWGPGGNTGEIKAARKGTGHPTSQNRWPKTSVLSNRHSLKYGSYMGLTFTFYIIFIY